MKHILLVEPEKGKTWGDNNQYVGLLRLASYYKNSGNTIEYVVSPSIPNKSPDIICVTSMFTYWYKNVWKAIEFYKMMFPKARVLLGGIYATICPDHAKKSGADEVIIGQHPGAKEFPPDPSILPYEQDFGYLFTSYGCNFSCTYCATHILHKDGIIQLPIERVIKEIEFVKSRGFKKIRFGDDNILFNSSNHINKICKEIKKKKLNVEISITGGMSAKNFTQETAYLMVEAGVKNISFALESISPEVRKKMGRGKNTNEQDLLQALEFSDRAGLKRSDMNVFFIIGLPYQTRDDMIKTMIFLIRNGVWAYPQRFTPIPHTVDWKRMKLESVDYEDLNYMNFVAKQDNFTEEDLDEIRSIARFFSVGKRYTAGLGFDWMNNDSKISKEFKSRIFKDDILISKQLDRNPRSSKRHDFDGGFFEIGPKE